MTSPISTVGEISTPFFASPGFSDSPPDQQSNRQPSLVRENYIDTFQRTRLSEEAQAQLYDRRARIEERQSQRQAHIEQRLESRAEHIQDRIDNIRESRTGSFREIKPIDSFV